MAVNKVVFGNEVKIDLTEDTVSPNTLVSGITAHAKDGNSITGTLIIQTFRTGTSEPDNSIGDNGDLYLVLEG